MSRKNKYSEDKIFNGYRIRYTDEIDDSPAAIIRGEKIIYIYPEQFNGLTDFEKRFVLFHEIGHNELNTDNEILADAYAFDHLAGTEYRSLNQMLAALEHVLDIYNCKAHDVRYYALYERAKQWLKKHPQKMTRRTQETIYQLQNTYLQSIESIGGMLNTMTSQNKTQSTTNTLALVLIIFIVVVLAK